MTLKIIPCDNCIHKNVCHIYDKISIKVSGLDHEINGVSFNITDVDVEIKFSCKHYKENRESEK